MKKINYICDFCGKEDKQELPHTGYLESQPLRQIYNKDACTNCRRRMEDMFYSLCQKNKKIWDRNF